MKRPFASWVAALAVPAGDLAAINGLSWRDAGGVWRHNGERSLIDLERLPLPDRSARLEKKFRLFRKRIDVAETSRGCPLLCNFCSIRKMYGQTFRRFPVERIVTDLKRMRDAGTDIVFFVDDNITYDTEHLNAICRAIIDNGLTSMMYAIQASAHGIAKNPDLVALMEQANIRIINLGLESMDSDTLKYMKKATSIEINREAMRLLKKHRNGGERPVHHRFSRRYQGIHCQQFPEPPEYAAGHPVTASSSPPIPRPRSGTSS